MTDNQFDLAILNKEVKNGGLFFGAKTVIKEIKKGNISKIYLANDLIGALKVEIEKASKGITLIKTDLDKEHLKEACKKPFNVSIVGIQKGNEAKNQEASEEKEESRKEIRAKKDKIIKARKEQEENEDKIEERKKISERSDKKEKVNKPKKEEKD